jgi:hypothetical protein
MSERVISGFPHHEFDLAPQLRIVLAKPVGDGGAIFGRGGCGLFDNRLDAPLKIGSHFDKAISSGGFRCLMSNWSITLDARILRPKVAPFVKTIFRAQ